MQHEGLAGLRERIRLGELLVQEEVIDRDVLDRALSQQQKSKNRLGKELVQGGYCTEEAIVGVLCSQLRMLRYDALRFPTDPDLSRVVPADVAREVEIVPLERTGYLLRVATTDPLDVEKLDALSARVSFEIEPVICTESDFQQLFAEMYGAYSGLDEALESFQELTMIEDEAESQAASMADVSVLESQAGQAPAIRLVNSIIAQAVSEKVSDVHISPEKDGVQLRFRVDGRLREVSAPPKKLMPALTSRIKILAGMDISMTRVPQDGRFTIIVNGREINIRASCLPTIYGENVVLRLLDPSGGVLTLDQLGIRPEDRAVIEKAIHKPYGLILSAGPTGSGKSSSLYSILKRISTPEINIITLEDPVEFRVAGVRQVQLNRRAGMTFASGLRSILRQDPDVIMVGEIRDAETAEIAVQAALTGHLVLATIHTNDSAGTATRLTEMGVEPFLVASVLLLAIAQRLARRVCTSCAEPYQPDRAALEALGIDPGDTEANFRRGRGCISCKGTGYRGRVGIFENLYMDDETRDMVLRRASSSEITRALVSQGKLRTLQRDIADKVRQGVTTVEEAIAVVMS